MDSPFHVALCCNGSLLPGLHATLASLVRNLSLRENVSLHLFLTGVDPASQAALKGTVHDAGGVGRLQFHDVKSNDFEGFATLHGDSTIYLRIMLPNLLPEAQTILYLDSDLIVLADVCEVFALPLNDSHLGAVSSEMIRYCIDLDVFLKLGRGDEGTYFNSGVLLFNAALWRKNNVIQQALEFARTHPQLLRSHDQTILNVLFNTTYYNMPARFNSPLAPIAWRLEKPNNYIYHFTGSPKPWDPFGSFMNNNAGLWQKTIRKTRFRWWDYLSRYGRSYASRTWALRKSYVRELKLKIMRPDDDKSS
jgi:lipopolysaccharide biosynthesis glycosyltransferase